MKKWFMIAMCVCTLASCSDGGSENPTDPPQKPEVVTPEITISSDILTNGLAFDAKQGEKSISFSTNVDWTLSIASTAGGSTWCKASATNGSKGSANVKFTVEEHPDYDDRSVSVTIKAGTASKTFTITQKCADALLVTTDKYEVAQDGTTIEVEVKANIDYQVAVSETAKSWISEVESKSRALTTRKHSFTIATNEDTEKREGEITFKSGDKVETVKVYQAGGPIVLLTKDEYSVSDQGETIEVDLKSNVEFGVKMPEVDWISEETASKAMSSHTLKYVISPNETYDSRSAEIVFYDKNSDVTDTLKVIQAQKDAIVISQKNYEVKSEGETIEVKLSANVDFEVTMPEADWVSQVTSRALTEHTLYFKVNENTSEDDRSAEIVFKDKNTDLSEKITITQKGVIVLSLTQDEYTISDAGETISVELKSNVEYGIQMPEVDWIKQETNTRASSTETLKFIVSANETYDSRSTEIVFYDKNSNVTDTLKISQAQKDAIVISQKNYEVNAEGETIEVKLSTNVEFEVTMPEADWVSQVVNSRALTEHTLYFKMNENTGENDRSAEIVFKDKNSNLSDTIKINQGSPIQAGYADGVVTIKTAGTMKSLLDSDYLNINSLKIVGPINGDDVYYLRKMSGGSEFNEADRGKLTSLDLSEATIVEGGGYYLTDYKSKQYYTSNNVIGDYMFCDMQILQNIVLPKNVTSIGKYAVASHSLTSISIGNGVTSIENNAFAGCNVTSIVIPDNVKKIGEYAFAHCNSLTSVTIGNGVTSIGLYAFSECKALTSIIIPDNVENIGKYAFNACNSLTSVTIGNGVISIDMYAFSECIALKSVTIGANVKSIGERIFFKCSALNSVVIPDNVTKIPKEAFNDCSALTSVTIGNGVTSIKEAAFSGCSALISVSIGNGVTEIGKSAFSGCSTLTSIVIPDNVTWISSSAFSDCVALKSVTIGSSVKKIYDKAFYRCSSLTSIIIPDNVKNILEKAFYGCSALTSITIGSGVSGIGNDAFKECPALKECYCYATTPPTIGKSYYPFPLNMNVPLYVPTRCGAAYNSSEWSRCFSKIIEMD